jgi:hypothetical protein
MNDAVEHPVPHRRERRSLQRTPTPVVWREHLRLASVGVLAGRAVGLAAAVGARLVLRLGARAIGRAPMFALAPLNLLSDGLTRGVLTGLRFVASRQALPGSSLTQGLACGVLREAARPVLFPAHTWSTAGGPEASPCALHAALPADWGRPGQGRRMGGALPAHPPTRAGRTDGAVTGWPPARCWPAVGRGGLPRMQRSSAVWRLRAYRVRPTAVRGRQCPRRPAPGRW